MPGKAIVLVFKTSEEAVRFACLLEKVLEGERVEFVVKGNRVRVFTLRGADDPTQLLGRVKQLYRYWRMSTSIKKGLYCHPLPLIFMLAELEISIPANCIANTLILMGRKAKIEGSNLLTETPLDVVIDVTERVSRAYKSAVMLNATPLLKRLVACLAAAKGVGVEEALELLGKLGIGAYDEDQGRWILKVSEEEALERLRNIKPALNQG